MTVFGKAPMETLSFHLVLHKAPVHGPLIYGQLSQAGEAHMLKALVILATALNQLQQINAWYNMPSLFSATRS